MDRAKERAIERCPKSENVIEEMRNEIKRAQFIEGYHQAEKDLALTWEDVHTIAIIEDRLIHELCLDDQTLPQTQEFYQEVLKRFNERKNKQTNHEEDNV